MEAAPDIGDPMSVRALKDITFGSIAGITSKFFEHPFDLTKVRLQSQVLDETARFSGPIDCLRQTFKNEGIRGLYRGLPAPIVGAMAENASLFWAYTELQNLIRRMSETPESQRLSLAQLALAGSGAGSITSFVLTPIELVKCKMQVQMLMAPSGATLPGPLAVLSSVLREGGLRGLWLGHTGTFIRETGGGAAWFASKEGVARLLLQRRHASDKHELHGWESAVSGACAGVAYNVALFPADSVKSTMQTEQELRPRALGEPGPTFVGTLRAMWRAQGLKGLYAGCGITVARAIPSSALIFFIYDGLSKRFSS
ncbi:mitochondrial carrier [Sparassis latifolia]|uniref:Amino-acid transporter arg-13 n=1 Tax=Sparassis crispa TaxID=139825 RepID=A0A401GZE7_9APHY|nr:Amino-acid transporter arg-13 [Sparassis crispa]GBE87547.1 Amino-acid transporter arg-13 [Sparassis crispa]